MRLLALPALLSAFVLAVPSPTPLLPQSPTQQPFWKSLSSRLITSIWGIEKSQDNSSIRPSTSPQRQAPPHTLARYGGDVVVRFNISTAQEAQSLADAADTLLLDVWEFSQDWVDIRLSKDIVPSLLGLLPSTLQNSHTALLGERSLAQAIYDTYPIPRDQTPPQTTTTVSPIRNFPLNLGSTANDDTNIFFSDYQPLSVIEPWMRLLSSLFTTHVRLINIGTTYEGRDIPALRVGVHPTNSEDPEPPTRKTVLVTGGVHAREWISVSTVNYIAYSLITAYGKNPSTTKLLEAFDFVFVPTLNPDGYVYSWETDRLWRKNRQRTNVRFCQGIDLDRGYGFAWDGVSTAGNPCSENFAGEAPFEAIESQRLASWARNESEHNNVEFIAFLDLHSYSQQILYPYSYSCDATPPGQENLEELALGLEKAIRMSTGYVYEVMPACEGNLAATTTDRTLLPRIESQGGSALDWFYHEMRVRYSYQIKLRDRGTYGFLLPRQNIVPTGKEILGAVLSLGEFLKESYGGKNAGGVDNGEEEEGDDDGDDEWVVVGEEDSLLQDAPVIEMDAKPDLRRRRKR